MSYNWVASGHIVVSMMCEKGWTFLWDKEPYARDLNLAVWFWQLDGGHGGWHPLRNVLQRTYRIGRWRKWKGLNCISETLLAELSKRAILFWWRSCVSGGGGVIWADLGSSNKKVICVVDEGSLWLWGWIDCLYRDALILVCMYALRWLDDDGWG